MSARVSERGRSRILGSLAAAGVVAAAVAVHGVARISGAQGDPTRTTPAVTLLYQNFPNPFPTGTVVATCLWFDLAKPSPVRLEILDVRGNLVRTIVPFAAGSTLFPAGRYGRGSVSTNGCDSNYSWDGTRADGSTAPAGVYLLRLQADGTESFKRILFRGR